MKANISKVLDAILNPKTLATAMGALLLSQLLFSCTTATAQASDNSPEAQCFEADTLSEYQYDHIYDNGFYFKSDNVMETFDREGKYYIVYDDIDAEFDYEVVQVDYETYDLINAAQSSQCGRLTGYLCLNREETEYNEIEVYTYRHDFEEPSTTYKVHGKETKVTLEETPKERVLSLNKLSI